MIRTIILAGVMLCALLVVTASPASAREWGYGRGYYPGPFYEPSYSPARRIAVRGNLQRRALPHLDRRAVYAPAAAYPASCKRTVLREDAYFGWGCATAWRC